MRVAIDWPSTIGYRVSRDGDRIEVAFTRPANIDLKRARADLPKDLLQIEAVNGEVARIYLTLAPGARLRDFRLGRTVVLDIMRPLQQTAAAPALRLPDKTQTTAPTIPAAPEPAPKPTAPATIAEPPAAPPPAPPTATPPAAEAPAQQPLAEPPQPAPEFALQSLPALPEAAPTPPAEEPAKTEEAAKPEEQPAAQPTPPPMPEIEQAALPPRAPVDVQIKVAPAEDGTKIMFAWPEAVPAAAFRRNGALWLAFDMPSNDVSALFDDARVARLGKASKIDIPDVTIIRIVEASPLGVSMTASGKSWIVDVTDGGKVAPTQTIEQRRETLSDGASSLLLRTNGPGRVAKVTDPGGGETLRRAGPAAGARHRRAGRLAGIPAAAQLPGHRDREPGRCDHRQLAVAGCRHHHQAAGSNWDRWRKSRRKASRSRRRSRKPRNPSRRRQSSRSRRRRSQPILVSVPGLFDLPSWRRGGEATFTSDARRLEAAVTTASEADEAAARMALGEFYFAHGLIEEADSALSQIGREGRSDLDQRQLALLSGAVQTLDGQLEKARTNLSGKSLQGVAEANLFMGLLAAREEKWDEAAQYLTGALPNIADYPKPIREDIYLTAGAALNSAGNPIAAQRFADALRQDQPSPRRARPPDLSRRPYQAQGAASATRRWHCGPASRIPRSTTSRRARSSIWWKSG